MTITSISNPTHLMRAKDLAVFHHHIYEYKKGIRNLILTTEKNEYREYIQDRLIKDGIDFVIHEIPHKQRINVFFGATACINVVKTFSSKLHELSAEQDFMLGIMLGYDRLQQCVRFMTMKQKAENKLVIRI